MSQPVHLSATYTTKAYRFFTYEIPNEKTYFNKKFQAVYLGVRVAQT